MTGNNIQEGCHWTAHCSDHWFHIGDHDKRSLNFDPEETAFPNNENPLQRGVKTELCSIVLTLFNQ